MKLSRLRALAVSLSLSLSLSAAVAPIAAAKPAAHKPSAAAHKAPARGKGHAATPAARPTRGHGGAGGTTATAAARVTIGAVRDGDPDAWRREKDSELSLDERTAKKLEALLRTGALRAGTTALYVVDAATGQELFSVHPDDPLNPASNVKLVSTATALDVLGADYRYRTRLLGPTVEADGTVRGDVYLLGSYDPTLDVAGLRDLARALARAGVKRITGGVDVGADNDRDGLLRAEVRVSVTATAPGKPAAISVEPALPYVVVDNDATTSKRKASKIAAKASESIGDGGPRLAIHITGAVGRGKTVTTSVWPDVRGVFAAEVLRAALVREGIDVGEGVRVRELGAFAETASSEGWLPVDLAAHESAPLAAIVAQINKRSINWLADRVVETAGAARLGGPPSMHAALEAMYGWLDHHAHIARGDAYFDTGSGLSHKTAFSARQIVEVLRAAAGADGAPADAHAEACHAAYLDSLSVGGVDGTLRGRFHGALRGKLVGKTGTLNQAIALSGFLDAAPGHRLAFALVTNGNPAGSHRAVRAAHEQLVGVLADYATQLARADGTLPAAHDGAAAPAAGATNPGATPDWPPTSNDLDDADGEGDDAGLRDGAAAKGAAAAADGSDDAPLGAPAPSADAPPPPAP